jgi:hypothetical protein
VMSVRELLSEGSLEYMKEQEEEALDQLASIRIANLTAKALQAFDEQEANTIFARISQGDAYMEWDHDGGWLTYWAGPEILFICSIASLYDPQIHP